MRILLLLLPLAATAADGQKRPSDDQRGKELYERHCVSCHGARAQGDGPATKALVVPIPDLSGRVRDDPETIKLVQGGRGAMPSFEASFDSEDTKRVLKWMGKVHKAEATAPAQPAPQEPAPPEDAQQGDGPQGDGPPGEGPPD